MFFYLFYTKYFFFFFGEGIHVSLRVFRATKTRTLIRQRARPAGNSPDDYNQNRTDKTEPAHNSLTHALARSLTHLWVFSPDLVVDGLHHPLDPGAPPAAEDPDGRREQRPDAPDDGHDGQERHKERQAGHSCRVRVRVTVRVRSAEQTDARACEENLGMHKRQTSLWVISGQVRARIWGIRYLGGFVASLHCLPACMHVHTGEALR